LFDASTLDGVGDTADRAERGIQHELADGLGIAQVTDVTRDVTAALFDLDLHRQLAAGREMGDDVLRIDDFDVMRQLDVAGTNSAFTFLDQLEVDDITVVQLEHDTLQVQKDVDDVFLNAVNGRVLMEHTIDANFGRRVADHRGQQDATQCIAQGMAITALERLHDHLGLHGRNALHVDDAGFQKSTTLHGLDPLLSAYFE